MKTLDNIEEGMLNLRIWK